MYCRKLTIKIEIKCKEFMHTKQKNKEDKSTPKLRQEKKIK